MANPNTKIQMFGKFTWTIRNFSTLESEKLYSDTFSLNGHTWRLYIYPKGKKVMKCLSIYLNGGGVATLPHGWEKFANFKLILINQFDHENNKIKETSHTFNSKARSCGYASFIRLDELSGSSGGFIVNDTCIIEVDMLIHKPEHEKLVHQSTSFGEVVDFKGIGKLDKIFVPLLEEVCSRHPLLIHSMKKRSQRFSEWGFTALGRVLHFLKTKKVRDMDDESCNHLQTLWEELETFGFDLVWLKPHVQSALGMKTHVERVLEIERLKENLSTLEIETKTLRTKMIEAEVNLEIARRDLLKEGFEECNLDVELGYGIP